MDLCYEILGTPERRYDDCRSTGCQLGECVQDGFQYACRQGKWSRELMKAFNEHVLFWVNKWFNLNQYDFYAVKIARGYILNKSFAEINNNNIFNFGIKYGSLSNTI